MKKRLAFLLLIFISILFSCGQRDPNKQIVDGSIKGDFYTSSDIGWTIEIPKGWRIMSKDKITKDHKKAMESIESTVQTEIDISTFKQLVNFQKDQFNIFNSNSEAFKIEYDGEWEDNYRNNIQILYETYLDQGFNVDTSSTFVRIDNLKFNVFKIKLYDPKGNVILYQDMYTRLINGFQMGVVISYNNDIDKRTMMKVWQNSKFSK